MGDYPQEVETQLAELREHYESFEENSRGANGYLFFARNQVSGQEVAIKFYCGAPDETQHDEPRQLAAISSPNVLPILDAKSVSGGWGYFATPKCADGDLDDVIAGYPSAYTAIDLAIGVCRGVSAIHAANMVHRDLKPGNVVLDRGRPRIADFGSVRKLEDGEEHTKASRHSVLYRPPESFEENVYTKSGDVYQVGLLSYQLLGGALPYDGESYLNSRERREYAQIGDPVDRSLFVDAAIGRRAKEGRLTDFGSLPPWISGATRGCLRAMINPDPTKRLDSVSEAVSKLTQARVSMEDWGWQGEKAQVVRARGRIELRPRGDGKYEAFRTNEDGKARRVQGVEPGSLRDVFKQVT